MIGKSKLSNALLNLNETNGYSAINVTISNRTIDQDLAYSVPMMQPYGFLGFPIDNTNGVWATFTDTRQDPFILGIIPSFNSGDYRFDSYSKGESVQYSINYSTMVKNSGVVYKLINTNGQITGTALIGEWIVKVLIDILTEDKNFINVICAAVSAAYNSHTHPDPQGGNTGTPSNTITFDTFPTDLQDDLDNLTAGKAYVNDLGGPVVP